MILEGKHLKKILLQGHLRNGNGFNIESVRHWSILLMAQITESRHPIKKRNHNFVNLLYWMAFTISYLDSWKEDAWTVAKRFFDRQGGNERDLASFVCTYQSMKWYWTTFHFYYWFIHFILFFLNKISRKYIWNLSRKVTYYHLSNKL